MSEARCFSIAIRIEDSFLSLEEVAISIGVDVDDVIDDMWVSAISAFLGTEYEVIDNGEYFLISDLTAAQMSSIFNRYIPDINTYLEMYNRAYIAISNIDLINSFCPHDGYTRFEWNLEDEAQNAAVLGVIEGIVGWWEETTELLITPLDLVAQYYHTQSVVFEMSNISIILSQLSDEVSLFDVDMPDNLKDDLQGLVRELQSTESVVIGSINEEIV